MKSAVNGKGAETHHCTTAIKGTTQTQHFTPDSTLKNSSWNDYGEKQAERRRREWGNLERERNSKAQNLHPTPQQHHSNTMLHNHNTTFCSVLNQGTVQRTKGWFQDNDVEIGSTSAPEITEIH